MIDYFSTGGYTEVGGLSAFLRRLLPESTVEVRWERRLPAVNKPGPKFGRATPATAHSGVTGKRLLELVDRMVNSYPFQADALVVVDDVDCRWCSAPDLYEALTLERRAFAARAFGEAFDAERVFFLMASPEVETWLLADRENSFEQEPQLKQQTHTLSREWKARLADAPDGELGPERLGCAPNHEAGRPCTFKLSAWLQDVLPAYNKATHGGPMLGRIDPDKVAAACTQLFALELRRLRRFVSQHSG